MTTIITGNFEQQGGVKAVLAALADAGFPSDQTTRFFVNPPTEDEPSAAMPAAEKLHVDKASTGAVAGAAIGGLVGGALGAASMAALGLGAPIAGAGVGAYVGSLCGAMVNIDDETAAQSQAGVEALPHGAPPRPAGTLVAVGAPSAESQARAIRILQSHGATDIDRCDGHIEGGLWTDFDRSRPLNRVTAE